MFTRITTALITTLACMTGVNQTAQAAGYTQTKYPVVLTHGMFGWNKMVGGIDYFYQVPSTLQSGGAKVYSTEVSGLASSEQRGEQLLSQVKTILAVSGSPKVNLFGHSHGGHSIRYVAAMIPGQIASVTAIGTPAKGSPVADLVISIDTASPALGSIAYTMLNGLDSLINLLSNDKNKVIDARQSMYALSSKGSAEFNAKFPQAVPTTACGQGASSVNGVRYYSWGGTGVVTTGIDPSDALMGTLSLAFLGGANDGLVGKCSSHIGQVLRDDYNMNHLDEVNQMLGVRALFTNPLEIYRQHANRLQLGGM